MNTLTFTLFGDVNVLVVVTETGDGSLTFDLSVLDETGSIGDLNAIFFDLADDSVTAGLTVSGDDVTGMVFEVDGVTRVESFTNLSGEVIREAGQFDAGIQFGTAGIAGDDIRHTSFTLSHREMDLSIEQFLGQDFGIRLTSVGVEDGDRDGSLKIGGGAPEEADTPGPTNIAVDDLLIVSESESFNTDGARDLMEGSQNSVLENDVLDTFYFLTEVESVNGDPAAVEQIVTGSNGGQMIIYADGTIDFSANGEFDSLTAGESAITEFTYAVAGGSTATLTVEVTGEDDADSPDETAPPIDSGIDLLG